MCAAWEDWTRGLGWRLIANRSTTSTYQRIYKTLDDKEYDVLRVSRFNQEIDGDTPHVETSIRDFNGQKSLYSSVTRDLGLTRFITSKGKPIFVIEPGPDVLEWRAAMEGVSVKTLVAIARAGDLGRRISRRYRQAEKTARAQEEALRAEEEGVREELEEMQIQVKRLEAKLAELEAERNEVKRDRDRMRDNLIKRNQEVDGDVPLNSGNLVNPIDTARRIGYKPTSTKPLPGNFEG